MQGSEGMCRGDNYSLKWRIFIFFLFSFQLRNHGMGSFQKVNGSLHFCVKIAMSMTWSQKMTVFRHSLVALPATNTTTSLISELFRTMASQMLDRDEDLERVREEVFGLIAHHSQICIFIY